MRGRAAPNEHKGFPYDSNMFVIFYHRLYPRSFMFFTHGIDLDTAPLPTELIKEPATINLLYYRVEFGRMPGHAALGSYN